MSESRTKNVTRNVIYAVILKFYQTAIPFLVRTIFIYKLGAEYLGLNSLFTSILGVLSMAELGFGTALAFSLYKPIAEKDVETVCAIMNFYKICYRVIGIVILVMGLILTPFVPRFIKSDLPEDVNVYVLYFIQLGSTVCTYFLFAYKNCLLNAHQRNDISSKIGLIISTLRFGMQIIILLTVCNYYVYTLIVPFLSIAENIVNAIIVTKMFPQYQSRGRLNQTILQSIISKVKALFVVKIGGIVLNSVDNIVISMFLGLSILGKYNNYYFIVNSVLSVVGLVTGSMMATLGNSLVTESKEKNYRDFKGLSFWNLWLVGWCSICIVCLCQHFVKIWIGSDYMLSFGMVILMSIYFYVLQSNQVTGAYKDAAGIWEQDQYRPLFTALLNLVVNLILVQFIGLYGIVLSTVISLLFVNTPWLVHNVCDLVFGKSMKEYFSIWGVASIITIINGAICFQVCKMVDNEGIVGLVIKMIICIALPNLIYYLLYFKTKIFKQNLWVVKKMAKLIRH